MKKQNTTYINIYIIVQLNTTEPVYRSAVAFETAVKYLTSIHVSLLNKKH